MTRVPPVRSSNIAGVGYEHGTLENELTEVRQKITTLLKEMEA